MSQLQNDLAALDGSTNDGTTVTCLTHLMWPFLDSQTALTGDGGEGVFFDVTVGGVSHRCTRISDTKHTVVVN
jgi:hypothetical protein